MVRHCAKDGGSLGVATLLGCIRRIEAEIHKAGNWTRRTMMYALIGLGGGIGAARKAAEVAVRRIEAVAFDPGNTAYEFPDRSAYITKAWGRRKGR